MLRWPPFVMRRPLATIVTMLAMLAQLGLGMSASLGLVMCVGKDHTAIALGADDCCASHGTQAPTAVAPRSSLDRPPRLVSVTVPVRRGGRGSR